MVVALAALLPPAFAARPDPYPYPKQPGALTAGEIQAATRAMTPYTAGETGFEPVASGYTGGAGSAKFTFFATPFARRSDRAETQQHILCVTVGGPWNCERAVTVRVTKDGVAQAFRWYVVKADDVRAAVEIVDFLYSPCFANRYAAIGGKPFTPSPETDYIESVVEQGKEFGVSAGPAGSWVLYQLQRTDKPADNCSFDIHYVKTAKSGVVLPANYAAGIKAENEQMAQLQQAARWPRTFEQWVVEIAMPGSIIVALLSLSVPWFGLMRSRQTAASIAAVLTVAATALFAIAEYYYRPGADIRLDLVIIPPLLLLAWLVFIGLTIAMAVKKQKAQPTDT